MSALNTNYTRPTTTKRSMSRPQKSPAYYRAKVRRITRAASDLAERVEVAGATARDLAMAIELNQQYLDALDEMLDGELKITDNGKLLEQL